MSAGGKAGAAMVAVLLLLLAAGGLAQGALLLARAELEASTLRTRILRERARSSLALEAVLRRDLGTALDSVPAWGARAFAAAPSAPGDSVVLHRLSDEMWWARGPGGPEPGTTPVGGRLVWLMDATTRVLGHDAVLTVGDGAAVVVDGVVDTSRFGLPVTSSEGASCHDDLGPDLTGQAVTIWTTLPAGVTRPAIGLLPFDSALARTPVRLDSVGAPSPTESGGTCLVDDPWNWGEPDRGWRPCGAHRAVRASSGPTRVEGGTGQGFLLIDGDVSLGGDARFHGVIVTSGALAVIDDASVSGLVVAAGGVRVGAGGRIEASACWALRAYAAARRAWGVRPIGIEAGGPSTW